MKQIEYTQTSEAVKHLKKHDQVLSGLIDKVGPVAVKYNPEKFSTLVRIITGQQLSTKAAATIFNRLKESIQPLNEANIQACEFEKLQQCGLSKNKAEYIKNLANAVIKKEINLHGFNKENDEAIIEQLVSIKGIGRWSAEMFLIFGMARPDVFSQGDIALKRGIRILYQLKEKPGQKSLEQITDIWRPYRSIASLYLWQGIDRGLL